MTREVCRHEISSLQREIERLPYIHLNYASAKRCASVMVEEIQKREGEKIQVQ
ncbi:MAG: hypothetical protein LUC90_07270 [Lachnospiraceae bacterium]|nr:hypothetical protein [Lachnospiraceae bacterium]